MKQKLEKIFILESEEKYNEAFSSYKSLLKLNRLNFEIWKHYFFFLWSMIEDVGNFTIIEDNKLKVELNKELQFGLRNFKNIAEFNFITGYTIHIFPYEFGDYEEFEELGRKLLIKAFELDNQNHLYEMVLLGSIEKPTELQKSKYENLKPKVRKLILKQNKGKGLLNEYYYDVFIRK